MEQYIRIGEMARLFGMNIRTLRYYDELGLFRPVRVDPDTGYRYYSVEQFEQLNTIRYLRTQGVGLEEIRKALAHRDPSAIRDLLRRQEDAVAGQIRDLELTHIRLARRISQIEDTMNTTLLDALRIEELAPRPVAMLRQPLRLGESLELPLRSLENTSGLTPSYFFGKVGLSISQDDLKAGRFDRYETLFCLLDPGECRGSPTGALPGGNWALWRFRGSHADAAPQYASLLARLNSLGLVPAGNGAEFALLDYGLTEDPAEFITELQIPVAPVSATG